MRLHSYPLAEIVSHIRVMVYPKSKPLEEAYVKQSQIHNHYTYKYNHFTYKIMCGARIITHIKSKKKAGRLARANLPAWCVRPSGSVLCLCCLCHVCKHLQNVYAA
jgi:hypothetical protein